LLIVFLLLIGELTAWSWYVMPPLQNYYLMDYLDSTTWQRLPNATTEVEWLYKGAPKRKPELISEADVVPATGGGSEFPVKLSPSATAKGWRWIEKQGLTINSARQNGYLKAIVYDGNSLWQVFLQPLLAYAEAFLFLMALRILWTERSWFKEWWRTNRSSFSWERIRVALAKKRAKQPAFIERKRSEVTSRPVEQVPAMPALPPATSPPPKKTAALAAPPLAPAPAVKPKEPYVWDESKWID
jgi:hypothetical protein